MKPTTLVRWFTISFSEDTTLILSEVVFGFNSTGFFGYPSLLFISSYIINFTNEGFLTDIIFIPKSLFKKIASTKVPLNVSHK